MAVRTCLTRHVHDEPIIAISGDVIEHFDCTTVPPKSMTSWPAPRTAPGAV
jgi:hypothetical protein